MLIAKLVSQACCDQLVLLAAVLPWNANPPPIKRVKTRKGSAAPSTTYGTGQHVLVLRFGKHRYMITYYSLQSGRPVRASQTIALVYKAGAWDYLMRTEVKWPEVEFTKLS